VRFIVHWQGGDHTELWLKKTPTGGIARVTSAETIELITSLARLQPTSARQRRSIAWAPHGARAHLDRYAHLFDPQWPRHRAVPPGRASGTW
jgi:hypothetical protein